MRKTSNKRYNYYKRIVDIKEIIEKRFNILIILILFLFSFLVINLFITQVLKNEYYINKVLQLTQTITYGSTAPRGRIYDRNHRLIVDNTPVKVITYKKPSGITTKEEIEISYKLANMIDINYSKLHITNLKEFWMVNNSKEINSRITEVEWNMLNERKITIEEINKLKLERVKEEDLNKYNELDKKAAYIYYLMNSGYSYAEKNIKSKDVTDYEYAIVSENIDNLKGINTKLDWEREYLYGNVFRSILGNVGSISYEERQNYISNGYSLNDRVGISYLEYQYESILKGNKNKYQVLGDGTHKLIEAGTRGNDIVLTIDIELQKKVEEIIIDELLKTKSEPNTEYYNRSFVIITDPNSGEIISMAGKQIVKTDDGYEFYDYTPGIVTSPVVVGSSVKGASHIVGYNTGALKIGEIRYDTCIKIAATPKKCSWRQLGRINDIDALRYSANVYQFFTAINVGGGVYKQDEPLNINTSAFQTYRSTFAEFGLGVKTGIDLPIESLGYKGTSTLSGHLLDFAIGQYDTYTPIQLSQYISTLANGGYRVQPYLLKSAYAPSENKLTNLIYETKPTVLNTLNTKKEYIDRVKEGFKSVMTPGGTGSGYIDNNFKPAGKTGTSQSYIDTDLDGVVDTLTLTNTFVSYVPYDNPKITFTVVSPDISHYDGATSYQSNVNKRISSRVSQVYFEMYK
ncbi:MAG TPA: penicillin-binding protein 2 [Tenericutes bacterium]|nr:penicillin-binding protein 2 [Mycoplasmatota bacterium]